MDKPTPSLQRVKQILGKYSIAPVRNWLKRQELTSTMNSRDAMVARVHGLVEKGDLTEDDLIEASIGIEEASSKRTFLYQIPNAKEDLAKLDRQLKELKIPISDQRTPSASPKSTSQLVYALNDSCSFRAKWNELHTRVRADKRHRRFEDSRVPKIIVLAVNKETGLAQLRYDKPDDVHMHTVEDEPSDQAYFDFYREKAENILGLPLEAVDFRSGLEKILKAEPRVIRTNYTVDDAEDGCRSKLTQKKTGKDIRDTENWKRNANDHTMIRTFEEAPLWWLPEMSKGQLKRELFCYVDATNGYVRFDANCYEDEIEYVLHQLVPKTSSKSAIA